MKERVFQWLSWILPRLLRLWASLHRDFHWLLIGVVGLFCMLLLCGREIPGAMLRVELWLALCACFCCALLGNTRPIIPGVIASAAALALQTWIVGLGSMNVDAGFVMLIILLGVPFTVFFIGLLSVSTERMGTIQLKLPMRVLLLACCIGVFFLV